MAKLGQAYVTLKSSTVYAIVLLGNGAAKVVSVLDNEDAAMKAADSLHESLKAVSDEEIVVQIQETTLTSSGASTHPPGVRGTSAPTIFISNSPTTGTIPDLDNITWTSSVSDGTLS